MRSFWIVGVVFLFVVSVEAESTKKWQSTLSERISKLVKQSGISSKNLGIGISYESFDKDEDVYQLNSAKKLTPASLTKIMTAGAVLRAFENNHKFPTQILTNTPVVGGTISGDIYLKGGGNPSFVSESLWKLVNDFTRSGIKVVEGNIVVDDSLFDKVRFDPGRDPSRVDRAYDAPIGAMSFNWNSVNVYVRPGDKPSLPAVVFADPESQFIKLVVKAKTVSSSKKRKIQVSRHSGSTNSKNLIRVSGTVPLGSEEKVIFKSITKPSFWSGYQLKQFLSHRGIEVRGSVVVGATPKGSKLIAEDLSKPVEAIIKDMMKFSNNFVAEMLTKNLAVKFGESQGTMAGGMKAINKFIESNGIKKSDYVMTNPSGLSRKNKFKAQDILKILNNLKNDFKIYPEFLVSMPVAGVDGTLKNRLNNDVSRGWMRAKTGRLNGTIGLAGYVKSKKHPLFTYVFMYNGNHRKINKAIELADKIAYTLVNES